MQHGKPCVHEIVRQDNQGAIIVNADRKYQLIRLGKDANISSRSDQQLRHDQIKVAIAGMAMHLLTAHMSSKASSGEAEALSLLSPEDGGAS